MIVPVPLRYASRLLNHGAVTLVSSGHGQRRNGMALRTQHYFGGAAFAMTGETVYAGPQD